MDKIRKAPVVCFLLSSLLYVCLYVCMYSAKLFAEQTSPELLTAGPFQVSSVTFTLRDTARVTSANGDEAEKPYRELKTTVWYPAEARAFEILRWSDTPIAQGAGPFPLLIYSHGFSSYRKDVLYLVKHMASYGYIVAAMDYPLSNFSTPGGPSTEDVVNQPGDISFLLNYFLEGNQTQEHQTPQSIFRAAIDTNRIGAIGLSLGAMTTELVTYHPTLRDNRFKAAVSIAGPMAMFTKAFFKESEIPFLMIGSTVDAFIPYDTNAMVVPERVPLSVLVSISNGTHTGFADVADPFLSFLSNPDSLGCAHIEGKIPKKGDMLERLGGASVGIDVNAKDFPCQQKELPKGLNPGRQHQLTKMAVLSFFESLFSKDANRREAMKKYLRSSMAEENIDSSVRLSEGYAGKL